MPTPPVLPQSQQQPIGLWLPLIVGALSGSIYAIIQGLTVVKGIIIAVAGIVIGTGVLVVLRQPRLRLFFHRQFPTVRRWLGTPELRATDPALTVRRPVLATPRSSVRWGVEVVGRDVYVGITSYGPTVGFWAKVEAVEGTADPIALPFAVRWREQEGERRETATGETELLYLACVEPEGNVDEYPIEHGAGTKHGVERRARYWKPVRCRFMGLSQEYVVYLDLGDMQPLTKTLRLERYKRRIRTTVRLRSLDGAVNEAKTVVLGIREVGDSRHSWGAKDAVVAEIEEPDPDNG